MFTLRKQCGAIVFSSIVFFGSSSFCLPCDAAHLRLGRDFGSSVFVSISAEDFDTTRLVCLAHDLKAKRHLDGKAFNVLFFSSDSAADQFQPPVEGNEPGWPESGRDLHAQYGFDQEKSTETLDILPLGYDGPPGVNTTLVLPVSASSACNLEIQNRCLMAVTHSITYPEPALSQSTSGNVVLLGKISSHGTLEDVRVDQTEKNPNNATRVLATAAMKNIRSWQFERGATDTTIRITFSYVIDRSLPTGIHTQVKWELPGQVRIIGNPTR